MEPLIVWGVALVVVLTIGLLCYLRSVASRRHWRCPACGERCTTEHLEATCCSSCGAALEDES